MSVRCRYVTLDKLFPDKSRATLYRWRKAGKLPKPDLIINGRGYYLERPLAPPADDARETADHSEHTA